MNVPATKRKLLAAVNPLSFFQKYFPRWDGRSNVSCLFHNDKTPSFAINAKTGQCYCHSAACTEQKFASVVHFYERYHHVTEEEAVARLCRKYNVPLIEEQKVTSITNKHILFWRDKLAINTTIQQLLREMRGLTPSTLKEYIIGFDPATQRITFPCFNLNNKLVNVRRYELIRSNNTQRSPKMLSLPNLMGGDSNILYPEWKLRDTDGDIILFGGETDTLLARQAGFNACCSLAGESKWSDDWLKIFKGRRVWVCLDQDDAGRKASKKIRLRLTEGGITAQRVLLPFRRSIHKDFTDWVVKEGNKPETLSKYLVKSSVVTTPEDSEKSEPASLAEVLTAHHFGKKYEINCLVAGKQDNPYIVPSKFQLTCSGKNPKCPACMSDDAVLEFDIQPHDRNILQFVELADNRINGLVKHLAKIPPECKPGIEAIGHTNLRIIWAIPDTAFNEGAYTFQQCFYTGDKIETNRPYKLTARLVSEPQTQKSTLLVTSAEPAQSSVESFKLTPKVRRILERLQPADDTKEAVWNRLLELAEDHSACRTRIVDRDDLHMVTMLTYHSPLQFCFDNDVVERGWINALVLGDTASGKSEVAEKMRLAYHAGEWTSGENCTFMGLVGGLMQTAGSQWVVRWGKIPLNDRRLVVVEELSGIAVEDIAKMTDVRSRGIARIDKGGHSTQTNSRTRLLFLANTRRGRQLHDFPSGAVAVADLIGNAEDIRRFDLIVTTRNAEVDMEKINKLRANAKPKFADEIHRLSVAWAWSLKVEDVIFTKKALKACLKWSLQMGQMYHSSIPLFKGEDGRYKIARAGAAIATQMFSCQDDGKVVVKACHVEAAVMLLNFLYQKTSMNYHTHSTIMKEREKLGDPAAVAEVFAKVPHKLFKRTVETMLSVAYISPEEFSALTGMDEHEATQSLRVLFRERGLRREKHLGWIVTPQLRDWLEQQRKK